MSSFGLHRLGGTWIRSRCGPCDNVRLSFKFGMFHFHLLTTESYFCLLTEANILNYIYIFHISCVVSDFFFQIDYLHRTGRTARMGAKGSEFTSTFFFRLYSPNDW